MFSEKTSENIIERMPWQLEEDLARAFFAKNPDKVARIGLSAISLEYTTKHDDELYEDARQIIIEAGKASTSYLQRKLKVGYARAARLMDMLEERGVIGAADGAKPREVIEGGIKNATSDVVADEMGI
jgi:DNA segregation ATPase FtsK/SpoIIIE-like protein